MNCRPHVMVCLNLVHNKAKEEFSLSEVTEAFSLCLLVRDNFREF